LHPALTRYNLTASSVSQYKEENRDGQHVPAASVGLGKPEETELLAADRSAHASPKIILCLQSFRCHKPTAPLRRMKSLGNLSSQRVCTETELFIGPTI